MDIAREAAIQPATPGLSRDNGPPSAHVHCSMPVSSSVAIARNVYARGRKSPEPSAVFPQPTSGGAGKPRGRHADDVDGSQTSATIDGQPSRLHRCIGPTAATAQASRPGPPEGMRLATNPAAHRVGRSLLLPLRRAGARPVALARDALPGRMDLHRIIPTTGSGERAFRVMMWPRGSRTLAGMKGSDAMVPLGYRRLGSWRDALAFYG
jgi:hypothetical protein